MDTTNKKSNKPFIITVVVIVVLILGYFFFKSDEDENLLIQKADSKEVAVGQELLILLSQVGNMKLDGAIFQNQIFLSLRDFGVPLSRKPVGRPNPFLPIGRDSGVAVPPPSSSDE